MGITDSFTIGRAATREARAEVKYEWIYITLPSYIFMAQRDNLTSVLNGGTYNCSVILSYPCPYHGGIGTVPLIHNLGTRWRLKVHFMLQLLYLQPEPSTHWTKILFVISKNKIIPTQLTCACACVHVHLYTCTVAHINFGYNDTNLIHEDPHI
jgi:hypothetical protein